MASYTTDYVVCLTSYPARKNNLLTVINSLEMQTVRPNCIYLTLYDGDVEAMRDVLEKLPYSVLVCRTMEDRKVWDKFLPRIANMPSDTAVLVVDDDMIYPEGMAEEMLETYNSTGDLVSGNDIWRYGYKCHCGCASLIVPKAFEGWCEYVKQWRELPSSDMFYTMLAAKNGYRYTQSPTNWYKASTPIKTGEAYSQPGMVKETYKRTLKLFGWL